MATATTILVSALIIDGDRALIVRASNGDWELPGGPLEDDESTEESLRRVLLAQLGIVPAGEEFLDTYYEQSDGGERPSIRNVYLVRLWSGDLADGPAGHADSLEQRWVHPRRLGDIRLPAPLLSALHDGFQFTPDALCQASIVALAGSPSIRSAVAAAMGGQMERAAYVDVDAVRRMIISDGAAQPPNTSAALSLGPAEVTTVNVTALAKNFVTAAFSVIIGLDVETAPKTAPYLESLRVIAPISLALLDASAAASIGQDLSLDSSRMTVEEMASVIVAHLDNAGMGRRE